MRKEVLLAGAAFLSFLSSFTYAAACEPEDMFRNDDGFIVKVVGGSDKVDLLDTPNGKPIGKMPLLAAYYVICEKDGFFRVTDSPTDDVDEALTAAKGYVKSDQIYLWPTREALFFSEFAWTLERPEIKAWDDFSVTEEFINSGDEELHKPAFIEDIKSSMLRDRNTRPYPVLETRQAMRRSQTKDVYNVLLPALLPKKGARIEIPPEDTNAAIKALESTHFLIAFDATGSMKPFANDLASTLEQALQEIKRREPEIYENSRMGFVFFRDKEDEEKIFITETYKLDDGVKALKVAAEFMKGGGEAAEPILDAVYAGAKLYNWGGGDDASQSAGAKRVIIAVLQADAKTVTEGAIDKRVPPGLNAVQIRGILNEDYIDVFAVQVEDIDGGALVDTLSTLAGDDGSFMSWDKSPSGGYSAGELMSKNLVDTVMKASRESIEIVDVEISPNLVTLEGLDVLPLNVVDAERRERLRRAGVKFNINSGEEGIIIQDGYMISNEDVLSANVRVDKDTLTNLIQLFTLLSSIGPGVPEMKEALGEQVAAIAGEYYDENENIDRLIAKQSGINFRSGILALSVEFIASMGPDERLAFAKRISNAASSLSDFQERNLAEIDMEPFVWMPMEYLP